MRARLFRLVAPTAVALFTVALTTSSLRAPAETRESPSVATVEVAMAPGAASQPGRTKATNAKHRSTPTVPPLLAIVATAVAVLALGGAVLLVVIRAPWRRPRRWRIAPCRAPPMSYAA